MGSLADRLNGVTVTQTRQSIGSQLRVALDDMVAGGRIKSWEIVPSADGRQMYQVSSAVTTSLGMFAGECMDWLNRHGYDIRFGKNPSGRVLGSDAAVAVGRFSTDGVVGYRARSGGPLRATRGRAEDDERTNIEGAAARREP